MRSQGGACLLIVFACGCGDTYGETSSGGAPDGGANADSSTSSDASGGGTDGGQPTDGGGPAAEKIPTVPAGSFRITPTEITSAQYKAFLDDTAGKTVAQPAECAWNLTFAPPATASCAVDVIKEPNRPVRCVDWCDARAYCEWAGLRLCGKIGGGPNAYTDVGSPAKSQWMYACGGTANQKYPYGASFNQAACHFGSTQQVDVGSLPTCEGGFTGIFDMLGNAGEWEDSCNGTTGVDDLCRIRGAYSEYGPDPGYDCGTVEGYKRNNKSANFGIRCCSK